MRLPEAHTSDTKVRVFLDLYTKVLFFKKKERV